MHHPQPGSWARGCAAAALLAFAALLSACSSSNNSTPPASGQDACDSADFQTVLNAVPAPAAAVVAPAAAGSGKVRIHYHRPDGTYTGWNTYAYNAGTPGESLGGWHGSAPTGSDSFGAYWDVPVTSVSFNFIINNDPGTLREPSNWSGKTGTDQQQFWVVADGAEIWKIQDDATNYKSNPLTAATPDITSVRVHYKRFDSNYAAWGVHIWDGSGLDVTGLKAGVALPDWPNPIKFSDFNNYSVGSGEIVFDIPVINPTVDATHKTLEFIIHGFPPNSDNKDGRSDNIKVTYSALTVTAKVGSIWLVQEDATVYTAPPDTRNVSTVDARAYWLTKSVLQWPKVDASGVFKLYYSATGQINAAKDGKVTGADGSIALAPGASVPTDAATRFKFVPAGVALGVAVADQPLLGTLFKSQLLLVQEDASGTVQNAAATQTPGALDDLYSAAASVADLGVKPGASATAFKLWAPTAQKVSVCTYDSGSGKSVAIDALSFDTATGVWSVRKAADLSGKYYKYVTEVFVRGVGLVRNLVTDPYSVSLTTDSKRSYVADLNAASLKPAGWDASVAPASVANPVDMTIYELHVRDFSANDATVSAANRGKFLAFTEASSNGMKHLKALASAGLTDVHLMPVFDIATVPESGCVTPSPTGGPADETQQAAVGAVKDTDCFNWGYDPYHYTAPEGSYASDASDGAKRIVEFRQMVASLHATGLRVGMDVVYNHTTASGQKEKSVLDRIVPGYYHRLDATGNVQTSTCCDNTATENLMMGKLMSDSVLTWAQQYKVDSFRFDLMSFQPRQVMTDMQTRVAAAIGHPVQFIGEGWNFGEVQDGARFVQASQLSLNGSGIGTFSDRARDFVRGGSPFDSGASLVKNQGYINGLFYDDNGSGAGKSKGDLLWAGDIVKVGLAGSIRSYSLTTSSDAVKQLQDIDYNGQPAGYVSQPQEVVNYVENHDNQTLFDINAYRLPTTTSKDDRARVQMLGAAINAFSQGVAYFHAGVDTLRSKSMDKNSYNSGDWFNRLDWSYADNNFGVGAPPAGDNGSDWPIIKPLLSNAAIKPTTTEIGQARDAFRDLLAIRSSSTLLRLRTADDIKARLKFYNTGSTQEPTLLVGHVDGSAYAGAGYKELIYLINVDKVAHDLTVDAEKGKAYVLHPVQAAATAADKRPANDAKYDTASGKFTVPPRSAVVYVVK